MSTNHRPTYVALVAALRAEFGPLARHELWADVRDHRYDTGPLGVLAQACHDASDINYDVASAEAGS